MYAHEMVQPISRMLRILRTYGEDSRKLQPIFEAALSAVTSADPDPQMAYELISGSYGACCCRKLDGVLPDLTAFCNCDFVASSRVA